MMIVGHVSLIMLGAIFFRNVVFCLRRPSLLSKYRIMRPLSLSSEGYTMNPDSKYGNYNYSYYFEDIKDVDPKDTNWEYVNPLEEYPNTLQDNEILEQLRLKKQLMNDVWQSTLFRDTQSGDYVGSYELFAPQKNDQGNFGLSRVDIGSCTNCISAGSFDATYGVTISITESYSSASSKIIEDKALRRVVSSLLRETKSFYQPDEFRTACGNQIVGSTFTISRVQDAELYVAELGIREGLLRVRVRYAYHAVHQDGHILSPEEVQSSMYNLELKGFVVIKEALKDVSPIEMNPLFLEQAGDDIYDPQAYGDPYVQLKFPPKLTIMYPRGMPNQGLSILSMQWEGQQGMIYQVDRKFEDLLGGIKTLELTEIRKQDVSEFPPTFKPVDLLK